MESIQEAIQFYLGRNIAPENINLYSLIGAEQDDSPERIKQYFAASAKRWNESDRKAHPELAKQVGALLKDAQRVLLDQEQRLAYNQKLAHKLVQDPTSIFDEQAFVESPRCLPMESGLASLSPEERFAELMDAISANLSEELASDTVSPFSEELSAFYAELSAPVKEVTPDRELDTLTALQRSSDEAEDEDSHSAFSSSIAPSSARPVTSRRSTLQQKLVTTSLIVLGGAIIAGVGIYAFYSGSGKKAATLAANSLATPVGNSMHSPATEEQPPELSVESTTVPEAEPTDAPTSGGTIDATTSGDAMPQPVELDTGSMVGAVATPEPSTPVDYQAWNDRFKTLKSSLEQSDFIEFKRLIAELPPPTGDSELDAKRERLTQLGQFCETGSNAFEQAKGRLKKGETLTVGNRELKIVASGPDSIQLQSLSGIKTYAWGDLPLGISLAVLEHGLPGKDPESLAAKASYLAFHRGGNELYESHIKSLLEAAQGNGTVRADLGQVLSDTYSQ